MEDDDDSAVAVSSMGVGPSLNDLLNANDDLLEYSHHHSINDMNSGSSSYLYRSQRDGSQIAGGAVDHDDEELPPPPYARYYASSPKLCKGARGYIYVYIYMHIYIYIFEQATPMHRRTSGVDAFLEALQHLYMPTFELILPSSIHSTVRYQSRAA